jgi:hypothetical protein
MREPWRNARILKRRRTKSGRDAGIEFEKVHETLAQKYFLFLSISIVLARSIARDARKSARRRVARTPNRDFGNKKIFCGRRVCGLSSLAKRRFRLDSIGADSRRPHARQAADL